MNTSVAREMIGVIKAEMERRSPRVSSDDPDEAEAAYEHWIFSDEPFCNELCLLLLVALRHRVERELPKIAARVTDGVGMEITGRQYQEQLKAVRKGGLKEVVKRLKLDSFKEWNSSMETLRLLANCYKHEIRQEPEKELLKHLRSDVSLNYMPLSESNHFRWDLAASLNLQEGADYAAITEEFLNRVEQFLADVRQQPMVGKVKGGRSPLGIFGY